MDWLLDAGLRHSVGLTAQACAASLTLDLALGVPLALWLARARGPVQRAAEFAVTLPLVFPPIALGYLLLLLLGVNGWVGTPLHEWFGVRLVFSRVGVMLAAFVAGLPLMVRPLQVAFESRAVRQLEELSLVCGASPARTFLWVTLPLVRNSLLTGLLLSLARASGEVGVTMMLGGNIAGRTNTLSLEIYNLVGQGDFDGASALCALLGAFSLVLYCLLRVVRGKETF